jgi:hypothetical protein
LRLEARLSFTYDTEREADSVVNAVSPDNIKVPSGLKVETVKEGRHLSAVVVCERPLQTFIATLDDLLACVSVAERAFQPAKAAER